MKWHTGNIVRIALLAVTLSIVWAGSVVPIASAQQPRLYLSPDAATYDTNDPVSLQILLDPNGAPVSNVMVFLLFDHTRLSFDVDNSSTNREVMNNMMITGNPRSNEEGVVAFSSGALSPIQENGSLVATIAFIADGDLGDAEISFSLTPPRLTELTDSGFTRLEDAVFEGGVYTVGSVVQPTNTPEPPPPSPTPEPPPPSPTPPPAGEAMLYFDPAESFYNHGDTVSVQVKVSPAGEPVTNVFLFVEYDTTVLALEEESSTVNSTVFNNAMITGSVREFTPGVVSLSAGATSVLTEDGTLVCTLIFQTVGAQGSAALVFMTEDPRLTELTNSNFDHIPSNKVNGVVNIGDAPVPTNTPEPPPPTETPVPVATNTPEPTATIPPVEPTATIPPVEPTATPGTSGPAYVYFDPASGSYGEGQSFTVTIRLDTNDVSPSGVNAFMLYDTTVASFVEGTVNRSVFDNSMVTNNPREMESGVVSFPSGSLSVLQGNGIQVATLVFRAEREGAMNLTFSTTSPRMTEVVDNQFVMLDANFGIGSYTFTGGGDRPRLLMDLNDDGIVNIYDLIILAEDWQRRHELNYP